ncbi:hypothetical protein A2442_02680 [Candidatus Campbellbacteria bacterium RIFOXYC2_FULL_35_25]|uniref:Uncharacterized protein n=1 Tax=Candidatus Campbellbacteria bacterium RIFOXYC2_FULL_35_25 TaxID=1797582 RepID=A0A1F5EIZ5_9BACT|nr:MAG: hypothetical protein A2442_02680 [Candidatus Campbellbacteria bacterium RIFOXYC2_FULL_35_25]
MAKSKGNRVVCDLDDEEAEGFELLKEETGVKGNKQLVIYALGLLKTAVEYLSQGYEMKFTKGSKVVVVAFPFLLFLKKKK